MYGSGCIVDIADRITRESERGWTTLKILQNFVLELK